MSEEITFNLTEEMDRFFEDSSLPVPGMQPKFVLLLGGVCSGKTTMRKQNYAVGYVVLDAAEIFLSLSRGEYYDFGEAFEMPMGMIGCGVAYTAIRDKRSIVTEMTGVTEEQIRTVMDAMISVGYKVEMIFVDCNIEVAAKRNLNRGPDNISAYYTSPYHIRWILDAIAKHNGANEG